MPVKYVTIIASREKDRNGKTVYRDIVRIEGKEVPGMTEEEYYDELARLIYPLVKPALDRLRSTTNSTVDAVNKFN